MKKIPHLIIGGMIVLEFIASLIQKPGLGFANWASSEGVGYNIGKILLLALGIYLITKAHKAIKN